MADETDEARAAADQVLAGVREALRLLEAVPDATTRARAAGMVLKAWPSEISLPSEIRVQAMQAMNAGGLDFPEIGRLLDMDRSRAWRIANGK